MDDQIGAIERVDIYRQPLVVVGRDKSVGSMKFAHIGKFKNLHSDVNS